ncbi:hypothetical protein DYB26_007082 [Aphanomyces astaci]|uniref:HTH CENPB-type domain-containing protein n=1 Tax=Aphanomyces astaci TaxID=112090 RepID=A0A418FY17_APHAT|nr:hypothetical protein DYB26_007082 [Aphanomyces astaci]
MESEAPRAARRPSTGRPVFKNWAKKRPKQHKNTVADYRERKAAIDHYELFGVQSTLDSMYGRLAPDARETKRKLIYSWVANRPLIERMASNPRTATMKCRRDLGTGTTLTAEAEEQLVQWVKGMRADGVPVTYSMLRIMALEAAIDLGLSEDEFRAGWHWVDGFKRRHGLSLRARTRIGQQTPEDGDEVLDDFAKRVQEIVAREGIDIIYNADQTAVNYEYLPTKTLNKKGENTVWVKCGGKTKDRMTAMLLADNSGTKHPLFLILRTSKSKIKAVVQENLTTRQGFGKRLWESVEPMQAANGVVIHGNPTAWWNASISMQFLKYHFSERHDRATKKVMLIWDDFSAHFTDEVTAYAKELNVVLERVPPNYTWICQPADVAWNRPLKARLRQNWLDMIRRQLLRAKQRGTVFKLVPPSRDTIVSWVSGAWADTDATTIINGFKKCHLVDGVPMGEVVGEGVVEDDVLAALIATCAIEETIDPVMDFSTADAADVSA